MYTPKFFEENDQAECLRFMREFDFATLVTSGKSAPNATHLPVMTGESEGRIRIIGHMARANPQWKEMAGQTVLVIFQGPHAYVSPRHYTEPENLPTWNYVAVHAYGRARVIESDSENLQILSAMVAALDPDYFAGNWQTIPDEFKTAKARGVVSFEITVDELQGKKKLNQNKSAADSRRVIDAFERGGDPNEHGIAALMREIYDDKS